MILKSVGDLVVDHSGLKIVGITEVTENLTYFYDNSKIEYSGAFPKSRKFGFLALKGRQHTSPEQRPG